MSLQRWMVFSTAAIAGFVHPAWVRAETLQVEHAVIARKALADNGTAHLYVRNSGSEPVLITSMDMSTPGEDELAEALKAVSEQPDAEGSTSPYLWWRSFPNPVPPGEYADLAVKLARPPARKLRLSFGGAQGRLVQRVIDRVNDAFIINSVSLCASRRSIFVYVENQRDAPISLQRVWINGEDFSSRARWLWKTCEPGGKTGVVLPLDHPMPPGTVLFVKLEGDEGAAGVCLTRAFHDFPITWKDGSVPEGLPETERQRAVRPGLVSGEGLAGIENIIRCPAHAHGTIRQAAVKFINAHEKLMQSEPQLPGMIYVCRWEKESNYFVFCELADFVRVMPFAGSASYVEQPLEHYMQWLTGLAVQASAPQPVHAVVPIRFADSFQWTRSLTPDEVRALVYLPLSRGVKGLCYGKRQEGLSSEARAELARVTQEVAAIREYLTCAEYVKLGETNKIVVEAAALLAGDRGMVLLVINHDFEGLENERVLRYRKQAEVKTVLRLPPGSVVRDVRDVEDDGRRVEWRQEGTKLRVLTPELSVVRPYLVLFAPRP